MDTDDKNTQHGDTQIKFFETWLEAHFECHRHADPDALTIVKWQCSMGAIKWTIWDAKEGHYLREKECQNNAT